MELVRCETKGGARPLTYSESVVAWAQADQLLVQQFEKDYAIVKHPLHGREILAVFSIDGFLLTGSEDTTIKVTKDGLVKQTYSAQEASVKCISVL